MEKVNHLGLYDITTGVVEMEKINHRALASLPEPEL
jgi:hypothetical protein